MSEVVSLSDFRAKKSVDAPAVRKGKSRGLGVVIRGPHSDLATVIFGGNITGVLPADIAFSDQFDPNREGRRFRKMKGIDLGLDHDDDDPEPPAPLVA